VQSASTQSAAGPYRAEPHLFVRDAAGLMDFLKRSFGAGEVSCHKLPDGLIAHAEMRIGDSTIGIGDAAGGAAPMPTALHLYVRNADVVYRRALAAGAVSIQEPADQEYGDREAGVKDPAGNHWYIATHKREFGYEQPPARGKRRAPRKLPHHIPEGMHSVTPYLHPRETERLIDFLERAFEARETIRVQPPGDFIHHAKVMIGDSMVELGEAHGPYGPLPAMFHLYVDDPDAVYRRALAAGGVSLSEPADQPWGFRSAGVQDPAGNQWWINAPIARVDTSESTSATAAAPPGNLNPVMPFMFIRAAAEAVEFYKHVFGARELMRETEPGGIVSHAQFQVGPSLFMISNPASQHVSASAEKGYARTPHELGGSPLHLYLQVPDVDHVFNKAIAAGAQVVHPLNDMEWGDRVGGFEDPFGHVWYVATPLNAPAARPDAADR
jgi:PhnB protein